MRRPLELELGQLDRHRARGRQGGGLLGDRSGQRGDRGSQVEGDEATVGGDHRAHVQHHAVLDHLDDRVGDGRTGGDLDVVVLDVGQLVQHLEVRAGGVEDQDVGGGDQLDPLGLGDGAQHHLELQVVQVRPLEGQSAGVVELAAEVDVEEVLDASLDVPVVVVVEEGSDVGVLPDLVVEAAGRAEVVEEVVVAETGRAESAEVDSDVLEEVVGDLQEARLDLDHQARGLAQLLQEVRDLRVHFLGLVDDQGSGLGRVDRRVVPGVGGDVVGDQRGQVVTGQHRGLGLARILFGVFDALGGQHVDRRRLEVLGRAHQVAHLVDLERQLAGCLVRGHDCTVPSATFQVSSSLVRSM